ncbi:MAG: hypothetical protein AMXMBFR7_07180 [Planctomycetota bacterium]
MRLVVRWSLAAYLLAAAAGAEEPALDATVYYSADDPHWTEAKAALEAAFAKHPRAKPAYVAIDTPEGYRKLRTDEERLKIKPGDLTVILGAFALTSTGERRDAERYLDSALARMLSHGAAKGRKEADPLPFAREVFGAEASLGEPESIAEGAVQLYSVRVGEKMVGYVAEAFRAISCPVCNDVQFLAAYRPNGGPLLRIRHLLPLERYGKALGEEAAAEFSKSLLRPGEPARPISVDAVSGATKTAHAYEALIRTIDGAWGRRAKPSPNP